MLVSSGSFSRLVSLMSQCVVVVFVNSLITMYVSCCIRLSHVMADVNAYRLNCREIFRGQGIHEETQHTMSSGHRKTGGSFGGSAIRTNPAAVRFNVSDSKVRLLSRISTPVLPLISHRPLACD